MIDWTKLTLAPAIRRQGALLRDHFGVWVGFVDADGHAYPIGNELVAVDKPACRHFKATSVLSNRGQRRRTCAQSLSGWASEASNGAGDQADRAPVETSCHAGFSAMIYAIDTPDGSASPCIYVSGYVRSEFSGRALGRIRGALGDNQLLEGRDEDLEDGVDAVPRLTRDDRAFIDLVIRGIAAEVDGLRGQSEASVREAVVVPGESFHGMIGASRQMLEMFEMIQIVAESTSTVLIDGENGTGKELVARALHLESKRRDGPFVALNCAAIPGELIASELFGHKKGAFSGAHRDRGGLLEEADGGTLLLDEIGDMDLNLQVKLLRFLQEGTYMPVGGNTVRKVDVRVLCATHQNLRQMVGDGQFRKDLFFRINVINVTAPPLRRRRVDIGVMANHFLSVAAKRHNRPLKQLSESCLDKLKSYDWPGNVRELENEIQRLVIISADEDVIADEHLSERIDESGAEPDFPVLEDMELPEAVEQLERTMILGELRDTGWNKSQTARNLGVSRRNLIRKVANFNLERFRDDQT